MDGLSAAASGIAVVSIAIQLGDSLQKASDFIESIQEAPEDIESTFSELQILSSLLQEIRPLLGTNSSAKASLENLEGKISSFMDLVNRYKPGLCSRRRQTRKWSAVKVATKREQFKKLRESLNDTKSTLMLALLVCQINSSQISSQQQALPICGDELNSQSNQSSVLAISSATQTSSPHDGIFDDLVNDLKREIQKVASSIKDPILQAVYQSLEGVIPKATVKQYGLTLEEEEEEEEEGKKGKGKAKPEIDIETEGVVSNTEDIPQGNNLPSDLSLVQKPIPRRSRGKGKLTVSKAKTLFGTFYLRSKVYEDCKISHYETSYRFHPANWLVSLGMRGSLDVMISRSTQGWQIDLNARTFRAVPEDALIFQFSEDGNIEGVKTLLVRGEGSLMDRDPTGFTLLHVAMRGSQYPMCKFLIEQGARKDAVDFSHRYPLAYHQTGSVSHTPIDFDVIRSCFEHLDYTDGHNRLDPSWATFLMQTVYESDGMYNVIESHEGKKIHPKVRSTCQSLLDVFGTDIKENLNMPIVELVWFMGGSLMFLEWFMISTNSEALTIRRDTGWSPLFCLVLRPDPYQNLPDEEGDAYRNLTKEKIKYLIRRGASLHYAEDGYTVTARAMSEARTFFLWREVLQELGIDIQAFMEEETEQKCFQSHNWATGLLVLLFRDSFLPRWTEERYEWDEFRYCSRCGSQMQPLWEYYLEFLHLERLQLGDRSYEHHYGTSRLLSTLNTLNYISFRDLCGHCREARRLTIDIQILTSSMPGSFGSS